MLELTLNGICLRYDFRALLLTGTGMEEAARRSKWSIAARGEVKLHLGVALFDRPFVYTPMHIITELQQTIHGEDVFDWLAEGSYRMPRSEVYGVDVYGKETQVFARDIDVEESPIAVFGDGTWVVAAVEVDRALGERVEPLDRSKLPERFRKALKAYRAGAMSDLSKLLSK